MNEELNNKELNNNETLINDDNYFPEIEIYVNKRKLSILIFVSLIFIVMGIFIFINRKEFKEEIISIFILILFSVCLLTFIIQLF